MKTIWILSLAMTALGTYVGLASAAAPTTLSITAPSSVGAGEDIAVEATLRTAGGESLAGVPLTLFQVGAVGEREMARATTNEKGVAVFRHTESTVADLSLRVRFGGDAKHAPAAAEARVEISGLDTPSAVVMPHTPSPLVKTVLFTILGGVWLTYAFAGSCIIRIFRHGDRGKGLGAARAARIR